MRKQFTLFLLSTCLTILFVVPFVHGQETPTVLKPNQLMTFSLAPEQEKLFVLQMKKGDFAGIESLAGEGLYLSFEIYDSARKKLLEESFAYEESMWFVAQTDGDFVLVIKPAYEDARISDAQRISIQYNNKFKLPVGTKQTDIRKINGYDIKIMSVPGTEADSETSIVLIGKSGQLKKLLKVSRGSLSFPYRDYLTKADTAYMTKARIAKEKRIISLIKSTVDKTGDGIPDVMIQSFSGGGVHCCSAMHFINLGETVETVDVLGMGDFEQLGGIDKNPTGGLLFRTYDGAYGFWLTSFATSAVPEVVLEFKNGKLRLNFDLMKKPAPSLAVLKNKAEFYRQKLSLAPYRGEENTYQPPDFLDPFYKEDAYPNNQDEKYRGTVYRNVVFWGPMLDLIYTGHEDLAWQFLDLVWPPQKQGKALFIRDFKKQLLESPYWQMILEDKNMQGRAPN